MSYDYVAHDTRRLNKSIHDHWRRSMQTDKQEFKQERKKTIDIESSCPKKIIFEVKGYPLQRIIAVGPTIVDRWEKSEACRGPTYHFQGD